MKTVITLSLSMLLLLAAPRFCFALMLIEPVSRERAKQLGMELRLKSGGTNEVWVELEFKPEGDLKDFSHVSMEISEGGKLLVGDVPLRGKPSDSGRVHVGFMANRTYLEKITLRVVTSRPKDVKSFDLPVKDFVCPDLSALKVDGQGYIPWDDAKNIILGCEVNGVSKSHALVVSITLKDGRQFRTIEPAIDDIWLLLKKHGLQKKIDYETE